MRVIKVIAMMLSLLLLTAGCRQKDLIYPCGPYIELNLIFNWRYAPDADPAGMTVVFYPVNYGEVWRFDIAGRDGGRIKVPTGSYNIVAYNSDAYNVLITNNNTFSGIGAQTLPSKSSNAPFPSTHQMPDMIWSGNATSVRVDNVADQTITLYPSPLNATYTVNAVDIVHPESIHAVKAYLSGLAEGVDFSTGQLSETAVTLGFGMTGSASDAISGHLAPFGNASSPANRNTLLIAMLLTDNSVKEFEFDVTDQVSNAPNPKNVTITVRGIELPEIENPDPIGQGGIDVNVDGWTVVRIDLK